MIAIFLEMNFIFLMSFYISSRTDFFLAVIF